MERSFRILLLVCAFFGAMAADHYLLGGLIGEVIGALGDVFPLAG